MALAFVVDSNPTSGSSKKEKRGVAFFGPTGYDIFGVIPAFTSAWNPGTFGHSAWDTSLNSDLALGQIQLQATHNVALQVFFPLIPKYFYYPFFKIINSLLKITVF